MMSVVTCASYQSQLHKPCHQTDTNLSRRDRDAIDWRAMEVAASGPLVCAWIARALRLRCTLRTAGAAHEETRRRGTRGTHHSATSHPSPSTMELMVRAHAFSSRPKIQTKLERKRVKNPRALGTEASAIQYKEGPLLALISFTRPPPPLLASR